MSVSRNIRLPDDLHEWLRGRSFIENRSGQDLIVEAIALQRAADLNPAAIGRARELLRRAAAQDWGKDRSIPAYAGWIGELRDALAGLLACFPAPEGGESDTHT